MTILDQIVRKNVRRALREAYGHPDLLYGFEPYAGYDEKGMSWGLIQKCRELYGEPIGKGLDRVVFQMDDDRVVKVAYGRGMSAKQNAAECKFYDYYKGISSHLDVTPTIYDRADDCQWIVMEYALPFTLEDLRQFGVPLGVFKDAVKWLLVKSGESSAEDLARGNDYGYGEREKDPHESTMARYQSAYETCCSDIRNFKIIASVLLSGGDLRMNIGEMFRIVQRADARAAFPNLGLAYDLNGTGRLVLLDTGIYGWSNGSCPW